MSDVKELSSGKKETHMNSAGKCTVAERKKVRHRRNVEVDETVYLRMKTCCG